MLVRVNVIQRGRAKMVGKIFPLGGGRLIFYHEESGSQYHRNFDSPGGVDRCVLDHCKSIGVAEVHHGSKGGATGEALVLVAELDALLSCPNRATYDGRDRIYLPRIQWASRRRVYDVPFATAEITLPLGSVATRNAGGRPLPGRRWPEPDSRLQPKLL